MEKASNRQYGAERAMLEFRAYTFKELAGTYFPKHDPRQASRNLNNLIKSDSELHNVLRSHGWKPGRRLLTPLQVSVIGQYLGRPEEFFEIFGQ